MPRVRVSQVVVHLTKELFNLNGKVALVTGGNRGIGKAIARGMAAVGANIIIAARDKDSIDRTAKEIASQFNVRVTGIACDVANPDQIKTMVSKAAAAHGRIDILVNNAGRSRRKAPQDFTVEEWEEIFSTNTRGVWLCSKEVYPVMKTAGGGKIINIASINSGHPFGMASSAVYCSSKGGVIALTKSLALAWAKDSIQVNAICPGFIDTDITLTARQDVPGLNERVLARSPLGHWGQPDDIAGAAIFLASKASDFVTGITLPVDGGYSAQLL